MNNPDFVHVVNIIESPSPEDIYEDRREGYSLVAALRLAEIEVRYFAVSNIKTLNDAVNAIANAPANMQRIRESEEVSKTIFMPTIHISAHGNESGIALTDGNHVSWQKLATILDTVNKVKGYIDIGEGKERGMTALSLSCCRGLYAKAMFSDDKPLPVLRVIGSNEDVPWSDALTGWITFYHLLITKKSKVKEAVKRMNLATGAPKDIFQIHNG